MKLFQPGIFDTPLIVYNRAVKKLAELDAAEASSLLDEYRKMTPQAQLDLEYSLVALLEDWTFKDAIKSDPETALSIWEQWETSNKKLFQTDSGKEKLVSNVSEALFEKVASNISLSSNTFLSSDEEIFFNQGRAIKCFMLAKRWKDAARLCEQRVICSEKPAKILGYHANCLFHNQKPGSARAYWLQACLICPDDIDMDFVPDQDTRELLLNLEYVCDENDFPDGPWKKQREWAAAIGLITGVFKVAPPDSLCPVLDIEYIFSDQKIKHANQKGAGKKFAAGLMLGFKPNGSSEADDEEQRLIKIRRATRELAPELFTHALKALS